MKWFKIRKPKDLNGQFVGHFIKAYKTAQDAWDRTNGEAIEVESIRGNMTHQTMFEVNGTHLVSMLDAYSEINGEPIPNKELHEGFLSTVATQVMEARPTSFIDAKPKTIEVIGG